jgi:hypothetical protein
MFLVYHYFNVAQLYKPSRVFVASYVWVSAYGNTLFFLRSGVSLARLLNVLLRVNGAALVLSASLRQPLMLYYVVPQTTLTVLVAAATAAVVLRCRAALLSREQSRSSGHAGVSGATSHPSLSSSSSPSSPSSSSVVATLQSLGVGLVVCGVASLLVWDVCGWRLLWRCVGDESITVPLLWGSRALTKPFAPAFEWRFRTALDHFSWVWGCGWAAVAHVVSTVAPADVAALVPTALRRRPVASRAAVVCAALLVCGAWLWLVAPLPKLRFNALHPYVSVVPVTAVVLARNATARLRAVYSSLAASVGHISLELYLLQV